jgi:PRTRC genetic system protein A
MALDPRDAALQQSCPCMNMPMFGALPALDAGQRMLLGRNGVFLQMRTPWLDCTARVGRLAERLPLPYGEVVERIAFTFGAIPIRLLERFIEAARAALPDEVAGALIHDEHRQTLALRIHEGLDVGRGHVRYRIAELGEGEVLAIDLHSHGRFGAFWSAEDDRDDNGVRVCGVFGHLDRATPTAKFRLVLNGHCVPLPSPWDRDVAAEG